MKKLKGIEKREAELLAFNPDYFKPLDEEEKQLQKDLDDGLYIENNDKEERNRISGLFKEYFKEYKKDGIFTIRVNKNILEGVKSVAKENGMNYQSFINMLLFKVAKGDLILKVENI
jgi:predicted DNA binding CopG/RHH family protein